MLDWILEWDKRILVYINNLNQGFFDDMWLFITNFNTWIPLFIFLLIVIYKILGRLEFLPFIGWLFALIAVVVLSIHFTKINVGRLRPSQAADIISQIRALQNPLDFSFFSGHAASSMAITTFIILAIQPKCFHIRWLILWPFLFSWSRMMVGVHYPIDLIFGAFVGWLWAQIAYKLYKKSL